MYDDDLYENTHRAIYGEDDEALVFLRICRYCGRFVTADDTANRTDINATCKRCGRVLMPFEGLYGDLYG